MVRSPVQPLNRDVRGAEGAQPWHDSQRRPRSPALPRGWKLGADSDGRAYRVDDAQQVESILVLRQKVEEKSASLRMMREELRLSDAELQPLQDEVARLQARLQSAGARGRSPPALRSSDQRR